ncbi:MAG: aminotransferase class I/II-fold pyridoxal phosphate-dependent enzyme [Candidatus Thiodiazotropha sp.]
MKTIKSLDDLAINGAKPAFSEPLHVGHPFVGDRKVFLGYVDEILDNNWLTNNGPMVMALEKQVAEHHDVKHCVAMCSGTVALEIAIRALKLEGEVIVPSFTFIATAHALHWQAIKPVFADISPDTHNLDPDSVRRMISDRTTGIIGVHLWGRTAPIEELQAIADEHNLKLLFDSAHAFGCTHNGIKVGNFGACEVLSFHATKFFQTLEGGAVLTNDDSLADTLRLMRNFGFSGFDNVIHPGTNGKMNEMSAAMGLTNLQYLETRIEHNRNVYHHYLHALSNIPCIKLLQYDDKETNNYQYIVIEISEDCKVSRDRLVEVLRAENILARRYFWPCCHRMRPYKSMLPAQSCSLEQSEIISDRVVVLPSGVAVDKEMIDTIVTAIAVLIKDSQ